MSKKLKKGTPAPSTPAIESSEPPDVASDVQAVASGQKPVNPKAKLSKTKRSKPEPASEPSKPKVKIRSGKGPLVQDHKSGAKGTAKSGALKVKPPDSVDKATGDSRVAQRDANTTASRKKTAKKGVEKATTTEAKKAKTARGLSSDGGKAARGKSASNADSATRSPSAEPIEEMTFANSPFADSPHSPEPDVLDTGVQTQTTKGRKGVKKAGKEKPRKQTAVEQEAQGSKKKRTKGGEAPPQGEEANSNDASQASEAASSNDGKADEASGGTGAVASLDDAVSDETLIDPAALPPEGEPGEEEEAEEPSLFGQESQTETDEREVLSEEEENRRYLKGIIEALLFSSDKALSGRELARAARIDKKRTLQLLLELRKEYRFRGVNIAEISGGFVLRSNPTYGAYVQKALALRPVRLSRAQLETLAIIAYRQPITRPEIDDIRGVDSGQVLKGLADRDLIKMLGKKDEAGRPMLYGTTEAFLELFSLESLKGLPSLREFTELSDDSKEKFAQVTGEAMPVASSDDSSTDSAADTVEGEATVEGDAAEADAFDDSSENILSEDAPAQDEVFDAAEDVGEVVERSDTVPYSETDPELDEEAGSVAQRSDDDADPDDADPDDADPDDADPDDADPTENEFEVSSSEEQAVTDEPDAEDDDANTF